MNLRSAMEPVAITGVSCMSGLGIGGDAFEDALFAGRTALGPVTTFDTTAARSHVGGHLPDFDPARFIAPAKLRRIDRIGRLAVCACRLALDDAGLSSGAAGDRDNVGVILGSCTAGLHSVIGYLDDLIADGPTGASAMDFSNTVGNAAASLCGIEFGLRGANVTLNYKEVSALAAVAYAANLVGTGAARAAVTGGVEDFESVFFTIHDGFRVLAFDEGAGEASRPFDRRRNGFVIGNGAFLLVLEQGDSARRRSATRYGEIAGIGATSSRCGVNAWPDDPAQIQRCMTEAIASAGLEPDDVGVVFASANSTRQLDRVEAGALSHLFGPFGVPVVALKGAIGESGASGAAGIIAALQSLKRGVVPPSAGFGEPDPDCPVDVRAIGTPPRTLARPTALVNSCASGGANYSVVVRCVSD